MQSAPEVTARARIRDAALDLFGLRGVRETTVRAIAERASVSPALVVHHFGSKHGLRKACDDYVGSLVRAKVDWAAAGDRPLAQRLSFIGQALMTTESVRRYLARALLDGSEDTARLYDEIVDQAETFFAAMEREGTVRRSEDPRARAALYVTWQLGVLALGEHLERALGIDDLFGLSGTLRFGTATVELLTNGVFTDDGWLDALRTLGAMERAGHLHGPFAFEGAPRRPLPGEAS